MTPDPHPHRAAGAGEEAATAEDIRLTQAAGAVAAATLLSRLLGYLRDAMIAWHFGAGFASDAFLAAFRIPDFCRRLLSDGTLSTAFVPVLTEALWRGGHEAARAIAASALRYLAVFLTLVCTAGVVFAPALIQVITPGFAAAKLELTVRLTRIMLPYLLFAGVAGLFMGILNVYGRFAAPALAPALLNTVMILFLLTLSLWPGQPTEVLAIGVLTGGLSQTLFQLPFLARHRLRLWRGSGLHRAALIRVGRLMVPAVLGGAVHQINVLAGTLLASLLSEGSVSYLFYADRVAEFPLGVVAIAGATAVLPSLAREAAAGDAEALKSTFAHAFRMVSFISLPALAGLVLLGRPIVQMLLVRGEFDAAAAQLTSEALSYYALGIWALAAVRIVVAVFFALQDSRTPAVMAGASIAANLVFGLLLMKPFAHGGLAATAVMSAGVAWASAGLIGGQDLSTAALATRLAVCIAAGVAVYAGVGALLRSRELQNLAGSISRSLRR
jgi:putative peptidoglycan lipid II flippase